MIKIIDKIKNLGFLSSLEVDNKKLFMIFLVTVVILYVDFNFILKAQFNGLRRSGLEVTARRQQLINTEKDLKNTQDLKLKQGLPEQKSSFKSKRFINESQVSTLLQEISNIANNNDVRILQVKPSRDLKLNTDVKFNPGPGFSPLYINLDLSGGYHQLGKFINDLENSQTLVMIMEVRIDVRSDNLIKQKASVVLKTYVKK